MVTVTAPPTAIVKSAGETPAVGEKRYASLDSKRGLAALIVLVCHCYTLLPDRFQHVHFPHRLADLFDLSLIFKYTPLRMVIDGRGAVMVFFVLSRFVLRSTFLKAQGARYWPYVAQRLTRLWIPYAVIIVIASGLLWMIGTQPVAAVNPDFSASAWEAPASWLRMIGALLASGRGPDLLMDPPLWSLVHEIRISLLFPLVAILVSRRPVTCLVLATAIHFICQWASPGYEPATLFGRLLQTGCYVVFFVLGFVLADQGALVSRVVRDAGKWGRIAALIFAILLLSFPQSFVISDALYGIGAGLLIVLAVNVPWLERSLQVAPARWLGRVSYSLYLTHLVLMAALLRLIYNVWKLPLAYTPLCAILIVCALTLAYVYYRLVEMPALTWSRMIGRRVTAPSAEAEA